MKCDHCGNVVEVFSDICPHCNQPFSDAASPKMRPSNSIARNLWIGFFTALILVVSILSVVTIGCVSFLYSL